MIETYVKVASKLRNDERGLSLLEYAAGAAILAAVVFVAMGTLGTSIQGLLQAVSGWANTQAASV
ncbi:MAG: Flp family type IVb pilin [Deltaproteobacteria bacterium]|nr:Flp family type IVb pilin [Deltaproteobacteria bacterium]